MNQSVSFISSYRGEADYMIRGHRCSVSLRLEDYREFDGRVIYNYATEELFHRQFNSRIGLLVIPTEVTESESKLIFGAWQEYAFKQRKEYEMKRDTWLQIDPSLADIWTPWDEKPNIDLIVPGKWNQELLSYTPIFQPRHACFQEALEQALANCQPIPLSKSA